MKIIPLQQPTSNSCGQTCVAMIMGWPVEEVFKTLGKKGKTTGQDLIRVLTAYGVETTPLMRVRCGRKLPPLAIVRFHQNSSPKHSHWCIRQGPWLFDPGTGKVTYCAVPYWGYMTSYIGVTR